MSSFSPVTPVLLHSALDGFKRRYAGEKPLTNYFLQRLEGVANLRMLEAEKSLFFFHEEWDFARLYFYTFDAPNVAQALLTMNWPPIVVTDWISKGDAVDADQFLTKLGFHLHATYDRIVCKAIRSERPNITMFFASEADREAIHSLLFRVFDKYTDHIMPAEELGELIVQKQVLLSRDPRGAIDGLVVFPVNGQNCNFNFLYNSGGSLSLAQLLGNFYGVLTERGVQSGFSWVRRTRPLVLKLHESFGWKKDGLVDYIYLR
jgi:hypothetical protein